MNAPRESLERQPRLLPSPGNPVLRAFAKAAPLFIFPTAGLGVALVLGDLEWLERTSGKGPMGVHLVGASTAITSVFVLLASPRVWPREPFRAGLGVPSEPRRQAGGSSRQPVRPGESTLRAQAAARAFAPLFATFSALIGAGLMFGGTDWVLEAASRERWALVIGGVALIVNAACAGILARELRPQAEKDADEAFGRRRKPFGGPSPGRKHA